MKITYDLIIDKVSSVFGEYPGTVDVSFHREGGNLDGRDGFETARVPLSSAIINPDGSYNRAQIESEVAAKIGETETVEQD